MPFSSVYSQLNKKFPGVSVTATSGFIREAFPLSATK